MKPIGAILLVLALGLSACQTTGSSAYPEGRNGDVLTVRYGDGLPMTIYLPPGATGPVPVLVYHHGRPFSGWQDGTFALHPRSLAVTKLNRAGIALAVPVRTGYYSTGGPDAERIPCNSPSRADFRRAGSVAANDVIASLQGIAARPEIDASKIYLAGFSAGGFAVAAALEEADQMIGGSVILGGGGRCGNRPPLLGGFEFADEMLRESTAASTKPVIFVAGEYDTVVPIKAMRALHATACSARGAACPGSVSFIKAKEAKHRFEDILWPARDDVIRLIETGSL